LQVQTYLDQINRHSGLGHEEVNIGPILGETRHAKLRCVSGIICRENDVVLLRGREAGASQICCDQALEQLRSQTRVGLVVARAGQDLSQVVHQLESYGSNEVAFTHGDELGHVPGILLDRRNVRLERPLRAVPSEGILFDAVVSNLRANGQGITLRD
jgi:hypothetical protein